MSTKNPTKQDIEFAARKRALDREYEDARHALSKARAAAHRLADEEYEDGMTAARRALEDALLAMELQVKK